MCGVAGYIGDHPLPEARLRACLQLMRRRGPDAQDSVSLATPDGRHLHLLHSRLAILDIDVRSNQPYRIGDTILAFNGEIYNYVELRRQLEAQGAVVATSGDTEVLARLLDDRGEFGLPLCEGMFAIAAFNARTGRLMLARDRFGEKPLWLVRRNGGFYFASEPKFIFAMLGETLPVNYEHLRRFLVNGYKSIYKVAASFFDGMEELKAGHVGFVECDGAWRSHPFWSPQFPPAADAMSYGEAVEGTRERLIHAVDHCLRSDVPVAFCLSGGIDSNALVGVAKRVLGYDVHGFTIMNTDQRYEERALVEASVRELGLRHTPVPVETADFLPRLRELVRQHDAPVYTITYYAQWRLMERVAEAGYKVSISGTGADELFSGYFDHHNAYLAAMAVEAPHRYAEALREWEEFVAPIVRNPYLKDPNLFVNRPYCRDHIYLDADVFSGILTDPFREPFAESFYTEPLLRNRMANELLHESVPVILHEDDLNAMYFSVENRSPFLNMQLFEFCQRIPTRHLVRGGRAKSVLREAVRGLAPDTVVNNPRKVGFNVPLFDYFDPTDRAVREELLADSPVWAVIRKDAIIELLDEGELPNSRSKFLFNFINAKLFLEEYAA